MISFRPYINLEKIISIPVLQTKKVEAQRGCMTCPKILPKILPRWEVIKSLLNPGLTGPKVQAHL